MEKRNSVKSRMFRGLINESAVQRGLFPMCDNNKFYLIHVTEFEDYGEAEIIVLCERTGSQIKCFVPIKYLEGLFVPFDTDAAKVLFGTNKSKFD